MTQNEKEARKWKQSRQVKERLFISGRLVLESPTHLGNGDASGVTDIGLLRDTVDGRPLLTGASLAGALRNYVRELELGYGTGESAAGEHVVEQLFGYVGEDPADGQKSNKPTASIESWLMVDDALGVLPKSNPIEIRDGVALDAATRAPVERKKYDIELLAAGTVFPLHFELWLPENASQRQAMLQALALALDGLEKGHIHLGMRKRRGFGRCRVTGWQVRRFAMDNVTQVVGWLNYQAPDAAAAIGFQPDIAKQMDVTLPTADAREAFHMEATFTLQSSLLIRSDSGKADAADMVHLTNAAGQPILSGTSLAGSIRARVGRIARTILPIAAANDLVNGMFGWHEEEKPDQARGSRIVVQEAVVQNPIMDRVQSRVKIDRFTGGAFPQALFSQQPLFARAAEATTVQIKLSLRKMPAHQFPVNKKDAKEEQLQKQQEMAANRFAAEIGLLLLTLKDLWTGDLPLGGEQSIGRGRLQGQRALLSLKDRSWEFEADKNGKLVFQDGSPEDLEAFVRALRQVEVVA
jgi:CRISPR/Cas system CSM-associated protein Csm3 (group 7 of RAMP superfamily)